jgi:hypothetical protein
MVEDFQADVAATMFVRAQHYIGGRGLVHELARVGQLKRMRYAQEL